MSLKQTIPAFAFATLIFGQSKPVVPLADLRQMGSSRPRRAVAGRTVAVPSNPPQRWNVRAPRFGDRGSGKTNVAAFALTPRFAATGGRRNAELVRSIAAADLMGQPLSVRRQHGGAESFPICRSPLEVPPAWTGRKSALRRRTPGSFVSNSFGPIGGKYHGHELQCTRLLQFSGISCLPMQASVVA